jgi:hypothetical protein
VADPDWLTPDDLRKYRPFGLLAIEWLTPNELLYMRCENIAHLFRYTCDRLTPEALRKYRPFGLPAIQWLYLDFSSFLKNTNISTNGLLVCNWHARIFPVGHRFWLAAGWLVVLVNQLVDGSVTR